MEWFYLYIYIYFTSMPCVHELHISRAIVKSTMCIIFGEGHIKKSSPSRVNVFRAFEERVAECCVLLVCGLFLTVPGALVPTPCRPVHVR